MKNIILAVSIGLLLSMSFAVQTKGGGGNAFNYAEYTAAKVLGMGGAYVAIANDENALFYNPAGLAFIPPGMLGHVNAEVTIRTDEGFNDIADIIDQYHDATTEVPLWGNTTLRRLLTNRGGQFFAGGGLSYFTKGLAIGAHLANRSNFFYSATGQSADVAFKGILSLGIGARLFRNLAIGVTGKAISRGDFHNFRTWSELSGDSAGASDVSAADIVEKQNMALNVGTMFKKGPWSFGASIENIWISDTQLVDADGNPIGGATFRELVDPITRLGVGYRNHNTLIALDVARPEDEQNMTIHMGLQQKLLAIPFIAWLGDVTVRGGYIMGKKWSRDISQTTIGASFRVLIAKLNVNIVQKKFGEFNELMESNVSAQITF